MLSVTNRQKYLKKCGFYKGSVNGIENEETKKAYLSLQKKYFRNKKDQDGIYGPNTDTLLVNAYRVKVCTKNFKLSEFECNCKGKYCTGYPVTLDANLLKGDQMLRDLYDLPITITGGLRCKKYNAATAGSITTSLHLKGKANDIYVSKKSDTSLGGLAILEDWKSVPKSNGGYQGTKNMGNATHIQVK